MKEIGLLDCEDRQSIEENFKRIRGGGDLLETVETEVPLEITWDGDLTGKETASSGENGYYVKISDVIISSIEDIIGSKIVLFISGVDNSMVVAAENIMDVSEYGMPAYIVSDNDGNAACLFVKEDFAMGEEAMSSGIWFNRIDVDGVVRYPKSLTCPNATTTTTKQQIKTELLPEGYPYVVKEKETVLINVYSGISYYDLLRDGYVLTRIGERIFTDPEQLNGWYINLPSQWCFHIVANGKAEFNDYDYVSITSTVRSLSYEVVDFTDDGGKKVGFNIILEQTTNLGVNYAFLFLFEDCVINGTNLTAGIYLDFTTSTGPMPLVSMTSCLDEEVVPLADKFLPIRTAIFQPTFWDDLIAGENISSQLENPPTFECVNMTLNEAVRLVRSGEALNGLFKSYEKNPNGEGEMFGYFPTYFMTYTFLDGREFITISSELGSFSWTVDGIKHN